MFAKKIQFSLECMQKNPPTPPLSSSYFIFPNSIVFHENQHFFHTLLSFWPDFYYFHRDFWHSKMLMCTLFREGGVGLRKCMVCTLMKRLTFMDGPYMYDKYGAQNDMTPCPYFFLFSNSFCSTLSLHANTRTHRLTQSVVYEKMSVFGHSG